MKRRTVLAGLGAGVATAALPAPAIAKNKQEFKLVTAWPKNFPGLGTSADRLARSITLASDGELTIKLYGAGELYSVKESFDAVSQGEADMYHAAEYYWDDRSRIFNFFASIPFGMTAFEMDAWLSKFGGQKLWDELSARFNIKALAAGNIGMQMGGWYNKKIEVPEDFSGMKVQFPGLGGDVLRQLGAETLSVPPGQIVSQLKSGQIQAAEWGGPWGDIGIGLHKAAQYYYWPGFHEPGTVISLGVNLDIWNNIKPDHRRIVKFACRMEGQRMLADFNSRNAAAIAKLIAERQVILSGFPTDVLNKFGQISGEIITQMVKDDKLGQRVLENFMSARMHMLQWTKYSEEAFLVARRLPFSYERTRVAGSNLEKRDLQSGALPSKGKVKHNGSLPTIKQQKEGGVSEEIFNPFHRK